MKKDHSSVPVTSAPNVAYSYDYGRDVTVVTELDLARVSAANSKTALIAGQIRARSHTVARSRDQNGSTTGTETRGSVIWQGS
jgi:hypothetical protein